jgi:zinc/manganese transport system substrate-binding protein
MKAIVVGALAAIAVQVLGTAASGQRPTAIVAAENFYGNVAQVSVTSILSNPNQDPHLFEVDASTARLVSRADIAIENGAAYDPWMNRLLAASPHAGRTVIVAAALIGRKAGDNPHVWYDPATMPALATALAAELARRDPANATGYRDRLDAFMISLQPLKAKIAEIRSAYAGTPVTATEPIFGDMAQALGLDMRNQRFQLATMNGTEPSISAMAAIEQDLRSGAVKVLFYNSQVTDDTTTRLRKIAAEDGVAVVAVSETMPAGSDYVSWMIRQLDSLQAALEKTRK